jgi:acid phosphatase type 7
MKKSSCWRILLAFSIAISLGRCEDVEACEIEQDHIHLAAGKDASTSMTISFATSSTCCDKYSDNDDCDFSPIGSVLIGTKPGLLNRIVTESAPPKQYSAQYEDESWYRSPYFHHITIDDLEPSTTYYYHCMAEFADEQSEEEKRHEQDSRRYLRQSVHKVFSFTTAPSPGDFGDAPVTFAFIADIGRTDAAAANFAHLQTHKDNVDLVMLAGDLSYAHLGHHRWDVFFDILAASDVSIQRPIMVAPGNHDVDRHPLTGAIFVAFENRFQMPQLRPARTSVDTQMETHFFDYDIPYPLDHEYGNAYYSFTFGPSHNIALCSYSSMDPGSRQYFWLEKELKSMNRTITPWVTVTMHSPMYNTFSTHQDDPQNEPTKKYLEPLFLKYKVNLVFSGHVHGYQRTFPTAYDRRDAQGPVYIIGGNGGCDLSPTFLKKQPWLASRDATHYGYATLSFLNQTHAHWKRVSVTLDEGVNNTLVGDQEDLVFPSVSRDSAYIVNQLYL